MGVNGVFAAIGGAMCLYGCVIGFAIYRTRWT